MNRYLTSTQFALGAAFILTVSQFAVSGEAKSTPKLVIVDPAYRNQSGIGTDNKGPIDESGQSAKSTGAVNAPSTDIFHTRGQTLENTFYEIDASSSAKESATKTESSVSTNKSNAFITKLDSEYSWKIWAAGAAGLVGLGAIGYFVLTPEEATAPKQNLKILTDKGE